MTATWRRAWVAAVRARDWSRGHPTAWRAVRDGLSLVGGGVLVLLAIAAPGTDSHAYWVFDASAPYRASMTALGQHDAFFYAPPVALFFLPFHLLPWPAFRVLWLLIEFGALLAVSRSWALALVALYPVALELSAGNVDLVLALIAAFGLRYPALWSVVLLTKVTPGIGLIWFAVRREWRSLGVVLLATSAIALVSAALAPTWWPQWIAALASNVAVTPPATAPHLPVPLSVRLVTAAVVVAWGARGGRRWTIPVAVTLALPELWIAGLSVLVGCLPLLGDGHGARGAGLLQSTSRDPSPAHGA